MFEYLPHVLIKLNCIYISYTSAMSDAPEYQYFDLDEALNEEEWECEIHETDEPGTGGLWWFWRWVFAVGALTATTGFFYLLEWHKQRQKQVSNSAIESLKSMFEFPWGMIDFKSSGCVTDFLVEVQKLRS